MTGVVASIMWTRPEQIGRRGGLTERPSAKGMNAGDQSVDVGDTLLVGSWRGGNRTRGGW
jgi:hypothetical protein